MRRNLSFYLLSLIFFLMSIVNYSLCQDKIGTQFFFCFYYKPSRKLHTSFSCISILVEANLYVEIITMSMTIFDEYITIGEVSRKNVDGDFILVEHRCCALVDIYI
jgi:hypothetical protein